MQATDAGAGDERQASGELSLADVDYDLVEGQTLRLVDGDGPGQLERELQTRAAGSCGRPRPAQGGMGTVPSCRVGPQYLSKPTMTATGRSGGPPRR